MKTRAFSARKTLNKGEIMKKVIFGIVAFVVVAGAAWYASPQFRAKAAAVSSDFTEWTPEAIEQDPVGYSDYCQRQFKSNLARFKERQDALGRADVELEKRLSEKIALCDAGRALAEKIAQTLEEGVFPAAFNGASYTKEQLTSQLKLLLAQVDGLQGSINEMRATAQKANESVQKLVVQIEQTETQMTTLAARREIFKTNKLTNDDKSMFESCRNALEEAKTSLSSEFTPVRTIEQLLKASEQTKVSSSDARVEEYLKEFRAKKESSVQTKDIPEEPAQEVE